MKKKFLIISLVALCSPITLLANSVYDNVATARISIYNHDQFDEEIQGSVFNIFDINLKYVETIKTNEEGIAQSHKLESGYYYVQQVNVHDNYQINDQFVKVLIDANHNNLERLNIVNRRIVSDVEYQINVHVTDQYGKSLPAERVNVTKSGQTDAAVTNESGDVTFNNVKSGMYTVCIESQCQNIKLSETNNIVDVPFIIEKTYGKITIRVTSSRASKLNGFEYSIFDDSDDLVEVIETNEDGIATSENLPGGDYYVIETKTGDGSKPSSEPYYFTIDSNQTTISYYPEEDEKIGSLSANAVSENELPLADVEFSVSDANGNFVSSGLTDDNGYIIFTDLKPGTYNVKITSMPDDFITDCVSYKVVVEAGKVSIVNNGEPISFYEEIKNEEKHTNADIKEVTTSGNNDDQGEMIVSDKTENIQSEVVTTEVKSEEMVSDVVTEEIASNTEETLINGNKIIDKVVMSISILSYLMFKINLV